MAETFIQTYKNKSEYIHHFTPTANSLSALIYPIAIGYFQSDNTYLINRASFGSLLLIYTISGCGSLTYNAVDYTLGPNTIAIFDCNLPHVYKTKDDYWEFKWTHFAGANAFDFFSLIYNRIGPVVTSNDKLTAILEDIFDIYNSKLSTRNIELLYHRHITNAMCEIMVSEQTDNPNKYAKGMRDVVIYIEENFRDNIKIDSLADIACMSKYHFIRKFKDCFSDSPYGYVIKFRLEKAKELLLNTDLKLENIAESTGFSNASHLIRFFNKYYNCSPYVYKTMLKNFYSKN